MNSGFNPRNRQGVQGVQGVQGIQGENVPGPKGEKGERGKKGKNGRSIAATIAFVVLFSTIGFGLHQIQEQASVTCNRSLKGYETLRQMTLRFTEQTDLTTESGVTDALADQHRIANDKRAADRAHLLKRLNEAPTCSP